MQGCATVCGVVIRCCSDGVLVDMDMVCVLPDGDDVSDSSAAYCGDGEACGEIVGEDVKVCLCSPWDAIGIRVTLWWRNVFDNMHLEIKW